MSFPLIWRSTHEEAMDRAASDLATVRSDGDKIALALKAEVNRLSTMLEASEKARRRSERSMREMAATLLEFANGKKSVAEEETEPEPVPSIGTSAPSRTQRLIAKAAASRQGKSSKTSSQG